MVIACFVGVVGVFTLYAGWLGCCCGLVFDAACCGIVLFFLSWLLVVCRLGVVGFHLCYFWWLVSGFVVVVIALASVIFGFLFCG